MHFGRELFPLCRDIRMYQGKLYAKHMYSTEIIGNCPVSNVLFSKILVVMHKVLVILLVLSFNDEMETNY